MKKLIVAVVSALNLAVVSGAIAGEAEVRGGLQQLDPHVQIRSIKPSAIDGLYEVMIGTDIYYVSADGKYIVSGNLFEAKTQKNLTEAAKSKTYLEVVDKAGESGMIIFEPKKKAKRTLTVFTDVDCPYCRKFHSEVPEHLKQGIRVRYVVFPLRGLGTETYKKSVSVWCSKNKQEALTTVKSGGSIPEKECKNPMAQNLALSRAMGITGTPTILTDEGVMYRGYVPKDDLYARLGLSVPSQARK